MTIHLKRLNCTGYITAFITIANRHAAATDGARQQALDEIARSLNNIAAIIDRHHLAQLLDTPVPPVPARPPMEEVDPADQDLADQDLTDQDDSEPTVRTGLTPAQQRVLAYIRTHPGCTVVDACSDLSFGPATFSAHLSVIRQSHTIVANGKPARYALKE